MAGAGSCQLDATQMDQAEQRVIEQRRTATSRLPDCLAPQPGNVRQQPRRMTGASPLVLQQKFGDVIMRLLSNLPVALCNKLQVGSAAALAT